MKLLDKSGDESNDIDELYGSDIHEEPDIYILPSLNFKLYVSILSVLCVSVLFYVSSYKKQCDVILDRPLQKQATTMQR